MTEAKESQKLPGRGGTLHKKKRAQMFRAWVEKQSMRYVARVCSVGPPSAKRYRALDNWDERLQAIQKKARAQSDSREAERLAGLIGDVEDIRVGIVAALKLRFPKEGDRDSKPSTWFDLDKVVRLEEYLRGHPDARTEHVVDPLEALIRAVKEHDEKKEGGENNKQPLKSRD